MMILSIKESFEIRFLGKLEVSDVNIDDIVKKLPTPSSTSETKRTKAIHI